MARYQQMLHIRGVCRSLDDDSFKKIQGEIASIREDDLNIDYAGLDEPIQTVVKDMVKLSRSLLIASCDGEMEDSPALENYIDVTREHSQHAGLAGWVACHCAMNLVQSVMIDMFSARSRRPIDKRLLSLAKDMLPFYQRTVSDRPGHSEDESQVMDFLMSRSNRAYRLYPYLGEVPLKKFMRLERGASPIALVDLLAESIRSGSNLPFAWMKTMPFSSEFIRPLVEKCRDCLPNMLTFLAQCHFVYVRTGNSLRVQDTQRILKIARKTDDPDVLIGVATALLGSSFLRIAKAELIQKILQAAPETPFAGMLFRKYKTQIEDHDQELFGKEINTVEQIARGVLDTPISYGFQTVCQAADFLAEHQHIGFPPLLNVEEKLGIQNT